MAKIKEVVGEVSFKQAVKDYFKGYVDFTGRSTRAGYWWMHLIFIPLFLIMVVLPFAILLISHGGSYSVEAGQVDSLLVVGGIYMLICLLIGLALLLPTLALNIRRFRDAGLRGRGVIVIWIIVFILRQAMVAFTAVQAVQNSSGSSGKVFILLALLMMVLQVLAAVFLFVVSLLPTDKLVHESNNSFLKLVFRSKDME